MILNNFSVNIFILFYVFPLVYYLVHTYIIFSIISYFIEFQLNILKLHNRISIKRFKIAKQKTIL